jgi:hypothetical protein
MKDLATAPHQDWTPELSQESKMPSGEPNNWTINTISTINTSDIEELKALTVKEVKALMTMGEKPPNH